MIHYLGTTLEEVRVPVIENGVAGLRAYQAGPGQGLAVMLVDNWQESDHDRLRAMAAGHVQAPAPTPGRDLSPTALFVAQLVSEVERDLANDGDIDAAERRRILGLVLEHLSAPAALQQLAQGHIDIGSAVQAITGLFRGK